MSRILGVAVVASAVALPLPVEASGHAEATMIASGLQGTIGGAIGPDGALYVPEGALGRISRVDPATGAVSVFADGLPVQVFPLGGVMDVAFVGGTAYALVTLVSPDVGGSSVDGIYRIDDAHHATVIADIGAWSAANPPPTDYFVPTGLQYALEPVRGGFLVSDGHHNRVLRVTMGGGISAVATLENVVPTGMAVRGQTVYVAETGPVPHLPETGKVVAIGLRSGGRREIASGYSVMVDTELGPDRQLYALSQGDSPGDVEPASPALPDSGELLRVRPDGTLTVIADHLDRPTSVHFVGDAALVVTLDGEVWRIDVGRDCGQH
jgi:hypothetical protein